MSEWRDSLSKYWNSWRLFGTAMMLAKAWEKFVIDRYRFRSGVKRTPTFFEKDEVKKNSPTDLPSKFVPLTICYLVHYFFPDKQGGTERFVENLAREQINLGNHVRVITLGKRRPREYTHQTGEIYWEEFIYEGIPVTQIRYRRSPRGLYYDEILPDDPAMSEYAHMALERYQPDVVHFAYPQPFAAFARICVQMGVPYCVTLTDYNMVCHYSTMVNKSGMFCAGSKEGKLCKRKCRTYGVTDTGRRYQNAGRLLSNAFEITVPSRFVAAVIGQEFKDKPMRIIPHGISRRFSRSCQRSKTTHFLYAGTLSELKGIHLLIEAFKQLHGDVALRVCGGGERNYVRALMCSAADDPRITFLGEIKAEDMPDVYKNVDCVVVPSIWYETYNFVLREALACGCIGVAANVGAMPEVIEEGKNGFVFEAGNIYSLRAALEKALTFQWSEYVQRRFPSVEDEGVCYQNIYQQIGNDFYDKS